MHGRQKVQKSPEEEAKHQKERELKVAAYQKAMKKIFAKRSEGSLDEEMLVVTGKVLAANPDIATLWNIRKEALKAFKEANEENFLDKIVPRELDLTEVCLKNNPKSYGAWHHRCWLMKETKFARVAEELSLCSKYLGYDDRNFHTWDYRKFLVDNSPNITVEQELKFTADKISANFSNFSSWHLRSKLLPQLSTKSYLQEELELVRNAVFTDPKDQSAWLYHMWLLKSQLTQEEAAIIEMGITDKHQLVLVFNVPVAAPEPTQVTVDSTSDGREWTSPHSMNRCKLWSTDLSSLEASGVVKVSLTGSLVKAFNDGSDKAVTLATDKILCKVTKHFDSENKPKNPQFEKLLREELNWVIELQEMEPDIKWPLFTKMMLMRMIDFVKFRPEIEDCIGLLIQIDPNRLNYYNDLRSKYVMEWTLNSLTISNTDMVLCDLNLTAIYYPERLSLKKNINLRRNRLMSTGSLAYLVACQKLDLSHNSISLDDVLASFASLRNALKSVVAAGLGKRSAQDIPQGIDVITEV